MVVNSNSGGGAYIHFLAYASGLAAKRLNVSFDAFSGVSSGLYVSMIHAVKGTDFLLKAAAKIDPSKAYKKVQISKKGRIKLGGWFNAISKGYLMEQDARPIIREIISPKEWKEYRQNFDSAPVYCNVLNATTGEKEVFNLKHYDFETALHLAEASAHIPGNTAPVNIGGCWCWDGGNKDHNPSGVLFEKHDNIKHLVSVWSRPKNWKLDLWQPKKPNIFSTLNRVLEIYNHETSLNDEYKELKTCLELGVKRIGIYNESRILNNIYQYGEKEKQQLLEAAKIAVSKI